MIWKSASTMAWHSDVARPLSYKPRPPIFSRPRQLFKDHQIINPKPLA